MKDWVGMTLALPPQVKQGTRRDVSGNRTIDRHSY